MRISNIKPFLLVLTLLLIPLTAQLNNASEPGIEMETGPNESIVLRSSFTFESTSLGKLTYMGFSFFTAEGYSVPFEEGDAALPFKTHQILVHPFAKNIKVKVTSMETESFDVSTPIAGIPRAVPYSSRERVRPTIPERYPQNHVTMTGEGSVRGWRVLDIRFDPVVMSENGLKICSRANFEVSYDRVEPASGLLTDRDPRVSSAFISSMRRDLLNPEDLDRFPRRMDFSTTGALTEEDVQYVIVTNTTDVGEAFDELAEWKIRKGVTTRIIEMSFIDDNYIGTDMAERTRNFIKDAYANWDTEFVLLGGDVSVVPYRGAYARTYSSTQTSTACDLYFSDLDGTWNADNDNYWGETSDGTDLRPDVYVGRAPVETSSQAETFVDKTLLYEMEPPAGYLDNATFAGEFLDSTTNSSRGLDLIKNGLLPTNYNTTSLYDSGKGDFGNLNRYSFMNGVDQGSSLVYHAGHCNWYIMSVGTAGSGSLKNSHVSGYSGQGRYGILNTVGCIANQFNRNDAIVEKHVMEPDGGTVAGIGNSHYGWYAYGYPGMGPSEQFQYQMTKEIFTSGNVRMAEHFAEGKENYVPNSGSYNSARWLQIVLNLIGDPEAMVRTSDPGVLNVSMPERTGKDFDGFPITVKASNGTAVEGALVCLQKSDFYSYNITNSSGMAEFDFHTDSLDVLNITVTAYNYRPFMTNITMDIVKPTIVPVGPMNATTGDIFSFNISAFDEAGIRNVGISFTENNQTLDLNWDDLTWKGDIIVPENRSDPIPFFAEAMDSSGNYNRTETLLIEIFDNDKPSIIEDRTHFDAYTGDVFEFAGLFTDNIGVETVKVEHWSEDTDAESIDMAREGDIWKCSYIVREDQHGIRNYRYRIRDTSGNLRITEPHTYSVADNDRPMIIEDTSSNNATTGDNFNISARVTDNIEVGEVRAEWWKTGWGFRNNDTMILEDGQYSLPFTAAKDEIKNYHYIFRIADTSGNWNSSSERSIAVSDNDPPEISNDITDERVRTGGKLSFGIDVRDNIQVDTVHVIWTMNNTIEKIMLDNSRGDLWGTSVSIPENASGFIDYHFISVDTSGNFNRTDQRSLRVTDDIDPTIDSIRTDPSVKAGGTTNISVDILDNIGIKHAKLYWWFGGNEPNEVELTYSKGQFITSLDVPLDAYGTLYIRITARDLSLNTVESERKSLTIIEYVEPKKEVKEEEPDPPSPGEDGDGDGMDDLWEFENGLNISMDDSATDADDDGFTNLEEFHASTDPLDPLSHPLPEEDVDSNSARAVISIIVLLAAFIASAVLFVLAVRNKQKKRMLQNPRTVVPVRNSHPGRDHHSIRGTDSKHPPHHSHKLEEDAIRHPHQHPVHSNK